MEQGRVGAGLRGDQLEFGLATEDGSLPADPVGPLPSFAVWDPAQTSPEDSACGAELAAPPAGSGGRCRVH
jgi:hypothetical protein